MYQPYPIPEDNYTHIGKYLPPVMKKFVTPRYIKALAFLGAFLIVASYLPSLYFSLLTRGEDFWERYVAPTKRAQAHYTENAGSQYQPAFDSSLPLGSYLKIPAIGVDTGINVSDYANYEDILKKGVWRAPDWGDPENRQLPMILAAHRYGYLRWSNLYRRQNSFFNLPKLSEGDRIEIIWRQRKYVYSIVGSSEGEEFDSIPADLILFTCRDLTSSIRIFKYAKLLEI